MSFYIVIYVLISLYIFAGILTSKFYFLLDMAFAPQLSMPPDVTSSFIFRYFLYLLNALISTHLIQKSLLLSITILIGVGMHRLVISNAKLSLPAAYFAGILFMINPFTYSRFMDGHWNVLFGYALLPFFTQALFSLLQQKTFRSAVILSLWSVAVSIVSIHTVFMLVIITGFATTFTIWHNRRNWTDSFTVLKLLSITAVFFIILSSYWLFPLVTGRSQQSELISTFDERHLLSFRTEGDPVYGLPFNVASLYGYWGDREDRYILPKEILPFWPLLSATFIVLAIYGATKLWKTHKLETFTIAATALTAWILAMGIAEPLVAPLNRWLLNTIPFFSGYREPQKFIGLIALAYAFFGGVGLHHLATNIKGKVARQIIVGLFLLLPFLYTPTMLWGFAGQLKTSDYPADWYALNEHFKQESEDYAVLFLPWHQYMYFGFADRVIASPAKLFFSKPVIQGDNSEIGLIYGDIQGEKQQYIQEQLLSRKETITNAGEVIARLNIKYIVVAKEVDWREYDFLNYQQDLSLISDTETLKVYLNQRYETR